MTTSYVKDHNGVPSLFVNGKPIPVCAYMTYLEEYNDYALFAEAGYRIFSFPVLFAGKWISVTEGLRPFHSGIFDVKGHPDFSSFERSAGLILEACPGALLLPRINISVPQYWTDENPRCLDGTGRRELLTGGLWKRDAGKLLEIFLGYLMTSRFADNIAGIQIAGGNTEEWFWFDLNGGCCENIVHEFRRYLKTNYPSCEFRGLPDLSPISDETGTLHGSEYLRRYLEFSNNAVADSVCYFAGIAKQATDRRLAVGTFYGYSLEVPSSLQGAHALKRILACGDIDFICSPNSYIGTRDADTDWTEMYPADSVRLHGKLCMQECDIRTHLTRLLCERAPKYDPERKLTAKIWEGLQSKEESIRMIRKSFGRQLRKGNGFWWFDMWGGWYRDPDIMNTMRELLEEYEKSFTRPERKTTADVAVFIDEDAYSYMTGCRLRYAPYTIRKELGEAFGNYDMYDVFDFSEVYNKYRAVVFLSGEITDASKEAVNKCRENDIPYLCNSFEKVSFTTEELKDLLK